MDTAKINDDIRHLADEIYWSRVERARRMSGTDKVRAGSMLFDSACRIMRDGIRAQYPKASESEVEDFLKERLKIQRMLENQHD